MRHIEDFNLENQPEPDHEAYELEEYEKARIMALEIEHQEKLDFIEAMKEYSSEEEYYYVLHLNN